MKTAHATLSNFRQAPRKMRMVANTVRGKRVVDALINLEFTAKKASLPIKTIKVDSGKILYRRMPAAQGSAHPIRKRTSSIFVELGENREPSTEKRKIKNPKSKLVSRIS